MSPARKIKPSKSKHFRGKEPFMKTRKMVHWESLLERDFIRIADFDGRVVSLEHQPVCIHYKFKGKLRKYFPDFKATLADGTIILIEVKPNRKLLKPENQLKFMVGELYCQSKGWRYHVVTEVEIRQKFLIRNISLLRALGNEQIDEDTQMELIQTLRCSGTCTIQMLRENCSHVGEEDFYKALYHLMYVQSMIVDLIQQPLTTDSFVTLQMDQEKGASNEAV